MKRDCSKPIKGFSFPFQHITLDRVQTP